MQHLLHIQQQRSCLDSTSHPQMQHLLHASYDPTYVQQVGSTWGMGTYCALNSSSWLSTGKVAVLLLPCDEGRPPAANYSCMASQCAVCLSGLAGLVTWQSHSGQVKPGSCQQHAGPDFPSTVSCGGQQTEVGNMQLMGMPSAILQLLGRGGWPRSSCNAKHESICLFMTLPGLCVPSVFSLALSPPCGCCRELKPSRSRGMLVCTSVVNVCADGV